MEKPKKRQLIHQINFGFIIPQIAVMLLLVLIFRLTALKGSEFIALAIYLLLSMYLKIIIPRSHRKGIFYLKKGEYEGAAYCFEQSLRFFTRFKWIDTYRAFTMLSISSLSYRKMAMINALYCYRQTGNTEKSKKFEKLLAQTPL